ncbi:hypothetical protein CJ030_MR7G028004 [Morella rubra]|uniref:Fe2OG dioxygenase domain-containing protein n=1 Tax=Morella rubra TaxID=262757 RepID=A0A6A1UZP8_9ROSI|nr:hypothetical protein CJ030_MR7G028004 [Morella rubra]
MATETTTDGEYDRAKEVKQFDDAKIGVKGLIDSGITTIPRFFVHPPDILSDLKPRPETRPASDLIPAIDLSGVDSNHRRSLIVDQIRRAADTIQIRMGPTMPDPAEIPEICRDEVIEWNQEIKQLGELLMGLLCEGLGVDTGRLKQMTCSEGRVMVGHYYPHCPQPDLTVGLAYHTDPGVLTVLQQDHVGGLQVKNDGVWVDVKPIPGALVINVGDLLQVISNEEFKSAEHRVLANASHEPRVSIAVFLNPGNRDDLYGPLPELISPEKPARYRQFTLTDFMTRFFKKELDGKSLTNYYKL